VHSAGAARAGRCRDGDWFFSQVLICGFENARAIDAGNIQFRLLADNDVRNKENKNDNKSGAGASRLS
jgi:hypothetical protein